MLETSVLCAAVLYRERETAETVFRQQARYFREDQDTDMPSFYSRAAECTKNSLGLKLALVLATVYSLWIVQRAFHGEPTGETKSGWSDLSWRELATLGALVVTLVWLGLYPQPVLDLAQPALEALR